MREQMTTSFWFEKLPECKEILALVEDESKRITKKSFYSKRKKEVFISDRSFYRAINVALFILDDQEGTEMSTLFSVEDIVYTKLGNILLTLFEDHLHLGLKISFHSHAPVKQYTYVFTEYQYEIIALILKHLDSLFEEAKARSKYAQKGITLTLLTYIFKNCKKL